MGNGRNIEVTGGQLGVSGSEMTAELVHGMGVEI